MFECYKNKVVLITGHTGFKGSWLTSWLLMNGASVYGVSLDPPTSPSAYDSLALSSKINEVRLNINDHEQLKSVVDEVQPDFVFHLAAQALVKHSYIDPVATWNTNVIGSVNLLDSLTVLDKKCAVVMITSDKCYENKEWVWGYRETDRLGGVDPYSASKASAELAISSYCRSILNVRNPNLKISSVRAGNVIGGGDWAADRIVPDCIKSWANGISVNLRMPKSTRPWQHVLEPLSGYMLLGKKLYSGDIDSFQSFNFGPPADRIQSVELLVETMSKYWDKVTWTSEPDNTDLHEAGLLKLNCDKALFDLDWSPTLDFESTIHMTVDWYKSFYSGEFDMFKYTTDQIRAFILLSNKNDTTKMVL